MPQAPRSWKGQEGPSLEPRGGGGGEDGPASPGIQTSGPENWETMNLRCSQLPGLWSFVGHPWVLTQGVDGQGAVPCHPRLRPGLGMTPRLPLPGRSGLTPGGHFGCHWTKVEAWAGLAPSRDPRRGPFLPLPAPGGPRNSWLVATSLCLWSHGPLCLRNAPLPPCRKDTDDGTRRLQTTPATSPS